MSNNHILSVDAISSSPGKGSVTKIPQIIFTTDMSQNILVARQQSKEIEIKSD